MLCISYTLTQTVSSVFFGVKRSCKYVCIFIRCFFFSTFSFQPQIALNFSDDSTALLFSLSKRVSSLHPGSGRSRFARNFVSADDFLPSRGSYTIVRLEGMSVFHSTTELKKNCPGGKSGCHCSLVVTSSASNWGREVQEACPLLMSVYLL